MVHPKTLQQRMVAFLLLPVTLMLFAVGALGFVTMRQILLSQWKEATIGKLERAAHRVDMKLRQPKDLIQMYYGAAASPHGQVVQEWILGQIRELEGVADVRTTWLGEPAGNLSGIFCEPAILADPHGHGMGRPRRTVPCQLEITTPKYDSSTECEAVIVHSDLKAPDGRSMGKIEVFVRLDYLLMGVAPAQDVDGLRVYLLDDCGEVIFASQGERVGQVFSNGSLETATLEAASSSYHGTVLGEGRPPREVSGFYKLEEAPWTFVMVTPGRAVLGTLVTFRNSYLAVGGGIIILIVLMIRWIAGRTVTTIQEVSHAANRVARGDLDVMVRPANGGRDELSRLIQSFNSMVLQLKERLRLKEDVDLAQEVQQSLLPQSSPRVRGLDLAGKSDYCDETGGDYFDFIRPSGQDPHSIYVAVGDVVGHGLGAALLMTTVRALLRGRLAMPGDLTQVVTDVNRLLCQDMDRTVTFMTLFLARIDPVQGQIRWVRAGHDPALLYDPVADRYSELQGGGPALGIDKSIVYEEGILTGLREGQILVLGTDGIWESVNTAMEAFGKERLKEIVRRHRPLPASDLVRAVLSDLDAFRDGAGQTDDATIVVAKLVGGGSEAQPKQPARVEGS